MATQARKKAEDKRTQHVDVRLTPAQKAAIERAARKATLDPSTWLRMIGLRETDWSPDEDDAD